MSFSSACVHLFWVNMKLQKKKQKKHLEMTRSRTNSLIGCTYIELQLCFNKTNNRIAAFTNRLIQCTPAKQKHECISES